jgi:hypothetical protein
VLDYMDHLQSIVLSKEAGYGFIAALDIAHRNAESLPLLRLDSLVFSRMDMDEPLEEGEDYDEEGVLRGPMAMEVLTEVLIRRAAGGQMHPIVRLRKCYFKTSPRSRRVKSQSTHV